MFSTREHSFFLLPAFLLGSFFLCTVFGADIISDMDIEDSEPVWDVSLLPQQESMTENRALFFSVLCELSYSRSISPGQLETLFRVLDRTPDSPFLIATLIAEASRDPQGRLGGFLSPEKMKLLTERFSAAAEKHPDRLMLSAVAADLLQLRKCRSEALALLRKTIDALADASDRGEILEREPLYAEYIVSKLASALSAEKRYEDSEALLDRVGSWNIFRDKLFPVQLRLINCAGMEQLASDSRFLRLFPSEKEQLRKKFHALAAYFLQEIDRIREEGKNIDLGKYHPAFVQLEKEGFADEVAGVVLENLLDNPDDTASLLYFARHAENTGKRLSAVRVWRRLFRITRKQPSGFYLSYAACLEKAGMLSEALRIYELALLAAPQDADLRMKIGILLYQDGAYERSLAFLRGIPLPGAVFLSALITNRFLNRPEETLEHCGRYFALGKNADPAAKGIRFLYADAAEKVKRYELVEKILRGMLKENPDSHEVLNFLGYTYADRGVKLDEAEKLIRRALELKPGTRDYLDSLAWVLYRRGKFAEALEQIKLAIITSGPSFSPVIWDHAGDICHALGDMETALFCWRAALSNYSPEPFDCKPVMKKIGEAGGAL